MAGWKLAERNKKRPLKAVFLLVGINYIIWQLTVLTSYLIRVRRDKGDNKKVPA